MTTNPKINRVTLQVAHQSLIDGLKKHEGTVTSFTVGGVSTKVADVIGALQADINAATAADSARAAWQAAVRAARDQRAKARPLVSGVRQSLQVMFAGSIDTLADFGLKPRKVPAARTPEQKAAAVAKAKATRTARHTMGTKQKKAVKGDVVGVTVAPVTATGPVVKPAGTTTTGTPPAAAAAPASHTAT